MKQFNKFNQFYFRKKVKGFLINTTNYNVFT